MTPDPETIRPHDTLAVAQEKMSRGRFRRLPVVDDSGALVGILTDGDLRQHLGYWSTTRVTAAMVENPVTISAEDTIEHAAELMLEYKIGGLPVLGADGSLVGIVTESDLLLGFLKKLREREVGGRADVPDALPGMSLDPRK
jgi:acetoin utilization protein AcuB